MKNWNYTIKEGEHKGKTLWSGRYCSVCAIVLHYSQEKGWMILLNKRGSGTPDFQHMWNITSGYIEAYETAQQACSREVLEECHVFIEPRKFNLLKVETNPKDCNDGNVTLRFIAFADSMKFCVTNKVGEKDEVEGCNYFTLDEALKLELAFNHKEIIEHLKENINNITMAFDASAEKELIEIN